MTRASKRSGKKALVCPQCVREVHATSKTARNVGSFRGRPAAYLRHIKNGHGRKPRLIVEDAA
jgi:hypothetical protein